MSCAIRVGAIDPIGGAGLFIFLERIQDLISQDGVLVINPLLHRFIPAVGAGLLEFAVLVKLLFPSDMIFLRFQAHHFFVPVDGLEIFNVVSSVGIELPHPINICLVPFVEAVPKIH